MAAVVFPATVTCENVTVTPGEGDSDTSIPVGVLPAGVGVGVGTPVPMANTLPGELPVEAYSVVPKIVPAAFRNSLPYGPTGPEVRLKL